MEVQADITGRGFWWHGQRAFLVYGFFMWMLEAIKTKHSKETTKWMNMGKKEITTPAFWMLNKDHLLHLLSWHRWYGKRMLSVCQTVVSDDLIKTERTSWSCYKAVYCAYEGAMICPVKYDQLNTVTFNAIHLVKNNKR